MPPLSKPIQTGLAPPAALSCQGAPSFFFLSWPVPAPSPDCHTLLGPHSYGSFPLISSPSQRHEFVRPVCRIHPSSLRGFMRGSRLHRLRAALWERRIPIVLPAAQDVKTGFRQVPSYCANGLGVTFALLKPRIQSAHVPFRPPQVMQSHHVGRFHKGPAQIAVDVGPQSAKAQFVAAGMDPRGVVPA